MSTLREDLTAATARLESLLTQKEPLEPQERDDLAAWLRVLQEDCETVGSSPGVERRMQAINARLSQPEITAARAPTDDQIRRMLSEIPRHADGTVRSSGWVARIEAPLAEALLLEILAHRLSKAEGDAP